MDRQDLALDARSTRERSMLTLVGCVLAIYLVMIREVGVLFVAGFVIAISVSVYQGSQKLRDGLATGAVVAIPTLFAVGAFVACDQLTFEGPRSLLGAHLGGFLHPRLPLQQQFWDGLRLQRSAVGRTHSAGNVQGIRPELDEH
jgi:hypothetical protein